MGKISDHELLSLDNAGSGWDNVLLAQNSNKQGVAIRMSWCASWEKINSREGSSISDWRAYLLICNDALDDLANLFEFQSNELE